MTVLPLSREPSLFGGTARRWARLSQRKINRPMKWPRCRLRQALGRRKKSPARDTFRPARLVPAYSAQEVQVMLSKSRRRAGQLDQIASLPIFCHFKIETIDLLPDKSWHGFLSHEQKNESREQEKRKNQERTSNSPGWEPPKTSPHVSHVQSMYRREYNRARQHTFDLRS